MNSLAFRLRIWLVLAASFLIILFATSQVLAQVESPSPSPTPSASASPSPDASPSPTPSSNSSTPSPNPAVGQATSSADDKQKVLGAATELGSTSRGRQIAKWVIAFSLGLGAFLFGLKILRNNAEE